MTINNPDSPGLKALYEDSAREYCWYIGQAANKAKMPDTDGMEVIKNQLLRLKPEINQWATMFADLSTPEIRKMR